MRVHNRHKPTTVSVQRDVEKDDKYGCGFVNISKWFVSILWHCCSIRGVGRLVTVCDLCVGPEALGQLGSGDLCLPSQPL